jgi:hypothetical protein
MAVGQKRGSRPAAGKSQTVRDGDERPVAASVDDLLGRRRAAVGPPLSGREKED